MKCLDDNGKARWLEMSAWYEDFTSEEGWEFLGTMTQLTTWVADQPFADLLYPNTSHQFLCVSLQDGYDIEGPFFSCCNDRNGEVKFQLWKKVGHLLTEKKCNIMEIQEHFTLFVKDLKALA